MFELVAKALDEKGKSFYWLSNEIGCSPTTLYEWKKGRYKPKIDKLKAISNILDIPIEKLIEGVNNGVTKS